MRGTRARKAVGVDRSEGGAVARRRANVRIALVRRGKRGAGGNQSGVGATNRRLRGSGIAITGRGRRRGASGGGEDTSFGHCNARHKNLEKVIDQCDLQGKCGRFYSGEEEAQLKGRSKLGWPLRKHAPTRGAPGIAGGARWQRAHVEITKADISKHSAKSHGCVPRSGTFVPCDIQSGGPAEGNFRYGRPQTTLLSQRSRRAAAVAAAAAAPPDRPP